MGADNKNEIDDLLQAFESDEAELDALEHAVDNDEAGGAEEKDDVSAEPAAEEKISADAADNSVSASAADVPAENEELIQMRAKLAEMESRLAAAAPIVEEAPSEPTSISNETLFGDWTYDKITESEEGFTKFLGEFANKIATVTEERVLRTLPSTVRNLTDEQTVVRKAADKFYVDHPKLAATKPLVAQIVSQQAAAHADWTFDKVLEESARVAYATLKIQPDAPAVADSSAASQQKPAFVQQSGGRQTPSRQQTALEKEISALIEAEY